MSEQVLVSPAELQAMMAANGRAGGTVVIDTRAPG